MVTQMVVQTDCRKGGEGMVVQIDKSKFGKRKVAGNRRGHRVEGTWEDIKIILAIIVFTASNQNREDGKDSQP
jgi:hypothetical protein